MKQSAAAKRLQSAYRLQLDRETVRAAYLQAKGRAITAKLAVIEQARKERAA